MCFGYLHHETEFAFLTSPLTTEMPWTAVPYGARNIKEKLSQLYGVQGIPTLVVLDENGKLLTKNGRGQVDKYFGGGGGGGGGRSRCVIS
mmetsp:Transcript_14451/g.25254  ORF Transcript_14451/g.25254 Transcript_14451/m.25254 type:complete len:90 (-) Transcript_14451:172-441(-)